LADPGESIAFARLLTPRGTGGARALVLPGLRCAEGKRCFVVVLRQLSSHVACLVPASASVGCLHCCCHLIRSLPASQARVPSQSLCCHPSVSPRTANHAHPRIFPYSSLFYVLAVPAHAVFRLHLLPSTCVCTHRAIPAGPSMHPLPQVFVEDLPQHAIVGAGHALPAGLQNNQNTCYANSEFHEQWGRHRCCTHTPLPPPSIAR